MSVRPVILCGGSGTRLWPASRPDRPKQFVPLLGAGSMFQQTVARVAPLGPVLVVAGERHASEVLAQLSAAGVQADVLIEPEARDSGPALAAAAAFLGALDPDATVLTVASDHYVGDDGAFRDAVLAASDAATQGRIVTFGVRPDHPSTAYGYILPDAPLGADPSAGAPVRTFREKPDLETARRLVAEGWLWNSGNFLFRPSALLSELDRHAPDLADAARDAAADARREGAVARLGAAFGRAPRTSIDVALMEKTDRAWVSPVDYPWSDLGSWDAVWAASEKDAQGNAAPAGTVLHDARGNFVSAPSGLSVALVGVQNLAVVAAGDALLVASRAGAQGVKHAAERLSARDAPAAPASSLRDAADDLLGWWKTAALPLWLTLATDHASGAFEDALHLDGSPAPRPRRARVQGRQLYVLAAAGRLGWAGPWRRTLARGADAFIRDFQLPDGLFAPAVNASEARLPEPPSLYDQAFALFGLAAAGGVVDSPAPRQAALRVLQGLRPLAHPAGGWIEPGPRPWQSNPHMHLFEAALAWEAVDTQGPWRDMADAIAALALDRMIADRDHLPEYFNTDWTPAEEVARRRVEPGHQFEWAWLLDEWSGRRGRTDAQAAARRLYAFGLRHGLDARRGVAHAAVTPSGEVLDWETRLWPQTERLRAAARFGDESAAVRAHAGLRRYLDVPVRGLWRDKLGADDRFVQEPAPASSLYHLTGAVVELAARAGFG